MMRETIKERLHNLRRKYGHKMHHFAHWGEEHMHVAYFGLLVVGGPYKVAAGCILCCIVIGWFFKDEPEDKE